MRRQTDLKIACKGSRHDRSNSVSLQKEDHFLIVNMVNKYILKHLLCISCWNEKSSWGFFWGDKKDPFELKIFPICRAYFIK